MSELSSNAEAHDRLPAHQLMELPLPGNERVLSGNDALVNSAATYAAPDFSK